MPRPVEWTWPEIRDLHAPYVPLYTLAGILIGGCWPRRQQRIGRWALWLLAAAPLSVTIISLTRGAPSGWSSRTWLHLAIVVPALTWVIGDGSRTRKEAGS